MRNILKTFWAIQEQIAVRIHHILASRHNQVDEMNAEHS